MGPLRRRGCDAGRRADRGRRERRLRRGLVRARRLRRRAAAGAGACRRSDPPRGARPGWATATPARCWAPSTRPASGAWRTARSPRTCCATAARRRCGARWRGSGRAIHATLEPGLAADPRPAAAFNLSILSTLIGTPWQPDLAGHVLMVEDVGEYMYRLDRLLLPRHQQPRHPPRRGLAPRPLQRDPRQRHRFRHDRGRGRPLLVRARRHRLPRPRRHRPRRRQQDRPLRSALTGARTPGRVCAAGAPVFQHQEHEDSQQHQGVSADGE